jgi:hypothetical protein
MLYATLTELFLLINRLIVYFLFEAFQLTYPYHLMPLLHQQNLFR